jgi:hypothetical protein
MSKEVYDFTEETLREVFTENGLTPGLTERAIADYIRYRESELTSFSLLSHKELKTIGAEALTKNLKSGGDIVIHILKEYLRYVNYKKEIAET